jgi:hypothetical protein
LELGAADEVIEAIQATNQIGARQLSSLVILNADKVIQVSHAWSGHNIVFWSVSFVGVYFSIH